jgi:hypothetical protein
VLFPVFEKKKKSFIGLLTHYRLFLIPSSQVEFDKPSELLKLENGRFRSLVDESGDRDLLYATANNDEAVDTTGHASD